MATKQKERLHILLKNDGTDSAELLRPIVDLAIAEQTIHNLGCLTCGEALDKLAAVMHRYPQFVSERKNNTGRATSFFFSICARCAALPDVYQRAVLQVSK